MEIPTSLSKWVYYPESEYYNIPKPSKEVAAKIWEVSFMETQKYIKRLENVLDANFSNSEKEFDNMRQIISRRIWVMMYNAK